MTEPDLSEQQVGDLRSWDRGRLPAIPRWVGVLALVVVLLGICGWVIGQQLSSSSKPKRPPNPTAHYVKFTDPAGTFAGAYPPNWKRLATNGAQYVLLAEGPDGASYEVAKTTLTFPVDADNLDSAVKLTQRIVDSGDDVKMIRKPLAVRLGGLPGILYLYVFKDPTLGEEGAHAHYFLFDGKTMITLVFQSLPSEHFVSLAPLFTRIASTFHVLPRRAGGHRSSGG